MLPITRFSHIQPFSSVYAAAVTIPRYVNRHIPSKSCKSGEEGQFNATAASQQNTDAR